MPKKLKTPAYTRHSSGQARVRIDGRAHYLGQYGTVESRERYDELVAEWLAKQDTSRVTLTVDVLASLYLTHAEGYYRKDGRPTSEVDCIRAALKLLITFAGRTRAARFGPRQFREFRDSLIGQTDRRVKHVKRTISRQYINKVMRKVVGMFKWAATEELVPVSVWHGLTAVGGLKKGRCQAREAKRVRPWQMPTWTPCSRCSPHP